MKKRRMGWRDAGAFLLSLAALGLPWVLSSETLQTSAGLGLASRFSALDASVSGPVQLDAGARAGFGLEPVQSALEVKAPANAAGALLVQNGAGSYLMGFDNSGNWGIGVAPRNDPAGAAGTLSANKIYLARPGQPGKWYPPAAGSYLAAEPPITCLPANSPCLISNNALLGAALTLVDPPGGGGGGWECRIYKNLADGKFYLSAVGFTCGAVGLR